MLSASEASSPRGKCSPHSMQITPPRPQKIYDVRLTLPRRLPFPAVHEAAERHKMTHDREEVSMIVIAYRQFLRGAPASTVWRKSVLSLVFHCKAHDLTAKT